MKTTAAMALTILSSLPCAHAFELGGMIGGNWTSLNTTGVNFTGPSPSAGIALGGFTEWGVVPGLVAIDVDVLYVNNAYFIAGTSETDISFSSVEVPVIARLSLLPIIKPGLGIKIADYFGNEHVTVGGTAQPDLPMGQPAPAGSGFNSFNVSAVFSLMAKFELTPGTHAFGELDYDLGLSDLSNPTIAGVTNKFNNVMALAGLSFGF